MAAKNLADVFAQSLAASLRGEQPVEIVQYAARKKNPDLGQPSLFETSAKPYLNELGPGRWITIHSSEDGGESRGGHRVYIGDDGKMKTGRFAGQSMKDAFGGKAKEKRSTKRGAKHEHGQPGLFETETQPTLAGIGPGNHAEVGAMKPGLAIDPNQLRGSDIQKLSSPVERDISNRRLAAAKRRLRLEREASPLFSDQIAELQPTPEQRIREMDERVKARFEHFDNYQKETWNKSIAELSEMSPDDQKRFMSYWNSGQQPDTPAYLAGAIRKFKSGQIETEAIVDRSDIEDPEKRKRVERLDKTLRTLDDIHSKAKSDSGREYASQRIAEVQAQLDSELGNSKKDKPSLDADEQAGAAPEPTPGIAPPKPADNASAKSGDQLGLFGDVANEPQTKAPPLKSGGETKGKQSALFDTKGDKDQMLAFDVDGATPKDRLLSDSKGNDEKTPSTEFEKAIESGDSPRDAAKKSQKAADSDYEFARASEVGNAGEDLKGSARHKVNEWKGLQDAEKDGTAEQLMTRANLLKIEPHNLMATIEDHSSLSHLAAHFAISAFPESPGRYPDAYDKYKTRNGEPLPPKTSPEALRKQYHDAYMAIKSKAEKLSTEEVDPSKVLKAIAAEAKKQINIARGLPASATGTATFSATDPYNPVANGLVSLANRANGNGYKKTDFMNRIHEFAKLSQEKHGDIPAREHLQFIKQSAMDVMDGKSMNKVFGKASKSRAGSIVTPSDMYVANATRKGGRDVGAVTKDPKKAVKHLVDEFGMRGVQWGNSVTDDERSHHAAKTVEALTDLADVTGLHPKDIAIDGKLGLAIGARGRGGASAHYEPESKVINLTRKNGAGTIAHEWGHAFDHWLADHRSGDYMSERNHLTGTSGESGMGAAFKSWKSASAEYKNRLHGALRQAVREKLVSQKKAEEYWNSGREVFARAFERYVSMKLKNDDRENTYLSGFSDSLGNETFASLWPNDSETKAMTPAFDKIFEEYRKQKHGTPEKVKFSQREAINAFWVSKAGLSPDSLGESEIVRYAGKDQMAFEWVEDEHPREPSGKSTGGQFTRARGTAIGRTGGKFSANDGKRTDLRVAGTSDKVFKCDRCGRTDLRKTICVERLDSDGNPTGELEHYGSDCVSKITGRSQKAIESQAIRADYVSGLNRKVKQDAAPKSKSSQEPDDSGKIQMVQAPAGGAYSEVTQKFYKGGHWMPVHGMHAGKEKPAKPPKSEGGSSPIASEDGKKKTPYARERSKEDIEAARERQEEQAKWDKLRSGPIGELFWTGDKPGKFGFDVKKKLLPYLKTLSNDRLESLGKWALGQQVDHDMKSNRPDSMSDDEARKLITEDFHNQAKYSADLFIPKKLSKELPAIALATEGMRSLPELPDPIPRLIELESMLTDKTRYSATEAQREAGNYKMRKMHIHGLSVSIETPKGQRRRPEWPPMPADYGYIRGTLGKDGDHVDVFIGPDHKSELVVVVDQVNQDGKFDEHKCLVGFSSESEAIETYKKAYTPGWKVGPVSCLTIKQFKNWLNGGSTKRELSKQVSKYSARADNSQLSLVSDLIPFELVRYEWQAAQHPRQPAGNEHGGEFARGNRPGGVLSPRMIESGYSPNSTRWIQDAPPTAQHAPQPTTQPAAQPAAQPALSSKKRELAEHPPTIKPGHALHLSELDSGMKSKLLDWNARMHDLLKPMDKMPTSKLSEDEQDEAGWGKVDKNAVRSLLAEMNQLDANSRAAGVRLSDYVNANKLIPKKLAERLDGGSRFFDPEKIRDKLHVSNVVRAPGGDQQPVTNPEQSSQPKHSSDEMRRFSGSSSEDRKGMLRDPAFRERIERAMGLSPSGLSPEQPNPFAKPAAPPANKPEPASPAVKSSVPRTMSPHAERQLDAAVNEAVGNHPEAASHFKETAISAWRQINQAVDEHNDAYLGILRFFDGEKTDQRTLKTKDGGTRTIQAKQPESRNSLLKAIRSGADPSTILHFDEMVEFAQREYPGAITYGGGESETGSAEDGLYKLLNEGLRDNVSPHSPEVIDQASEMVGPHFWEQISNPDYEDDQDVANATSSLGHDEEIPFSIRNDIQAALIRYWGRAGDKQSA